MLCANLENDMKGYLLLHKYTSSICIGTATLAHSTNMVSQTFSNLLAPKYIHAPVQEIYDLDNVLTKNQCRMVRD